MSAEYVNPDSLEQRIERLERALQGKGDYDTGWVDLGTVATYAANWGPFATAAFRPMVRRFPSGLIIFRGLVAKSAALTGAAETMFTMNPGWRVNDVGFGGSAPTTPFLAANFAKVYTELRTYSTGLVQLDSGGSATWVGLGNLWYAVAPS